jgi:hypothetical protein
MFSVTYITGETVIQQGTTFDLFSLWREVNLLVVVPT